MIVVALALGAGAGFFAAYVARNWLQLTATLAAASDDAERVIDDTAMFVGLVVGLIVWALILAIAGAANQIAPRHNKGDLKSFRLSRPQ